MIKRMCYCFAAILLSACGKENTVQQDMPALFSLLSADQTGIHFKQNSSLHPNDVAGISSGGGGVAAGDINNDGLPDLLFSGGVQNSGLFLNEGDLHFKDITKSAGIKDFEEGDAYTECVNFVDINGDGFLDIYITKLGIAGDFKTGQFTDFGANLLYVNNGDLTFTEKAREYGLDLIGQTIAAQFFDYDNDGDLDVYLIQGSEPGSTFNFIYYEKKPAFKWFRDMMLENQDGRFVDVTDRAGILNQRNIGLSISISDVNNDGFQDIYVANDFFGRDYFYLNNGDKTFREAFKTYFSKSPMSSMGSDFGDVDDDGYEDLFVGEMMPATYQRQKTNLVPFSIQVYEQCAREQAPQYTRNMLSRNFGGKRLRDLGFFAGVYATEWSWSSFFFDADLDGSKDLFIANGIRRDMTNMDYVKSNFGESYTEMANPVKQKEANLVNIPSVTTPNFIFKNGGDFQFSDVSKDWGLTDKVHTRGATYADLDNDGDLELIWNNLDAPPSIYKNLAREKTGNHYLKLRLKAAGRNTFGIGARVEIRNGHGEKRFFALRNQRGFQSTPEPVILAGLDRAAAADSVIVYWPSGKTTLHPGLAADQTHLLEESGSDDWTPAPAAVQPLFSAENLIQYVHPENHDYVDFKNERLIPRTYSKMGPYIATGDLNNDRRTDIYITGAGGKTGTAWFQTASGTFSKREYATRPPVANLEEYATSIFDYDGDGHNELFLTYGSNENGALIGKGFYRFDAGGQSTILPLPGMTTDQLIIFATAAHADIDGDGDLDIFLGGLLKPGEFGNMPRSYLFLNDKGQYTEAGASWAKDLANPGMVRKAVFADINGDQRPDLILAGEWMGIQYYINEGNGFSKQEISGTKGLWNTLEVFDADGDGDLDLVAGNLGKNQLWRASASKPLTLLAGDFDKNGSLDPLIFYYQGDTRGVFSNRDLFVSQMPLMNKKYWNFSDFANASYNNILTPEERADAKTYDAEELETCLFINDGGTFSLRRLPAMAQTSDCEAILPFDFNKDGHVDLLLAGNSNQMHYESGNMDASEGWLLIGKGDGSFTAHDAGEYGLDLSGFVRDLDMIGVNGANFLIVANNSSAVQTYRLR